MCSTRGGRSKRGYEGKEEEYFFLENFTKTGRKNEFSFFFNELIS